jgi:hypothetical protein
MAGAATAAALVLTSIFPLAAQDDTTCEYAPAIVAISNTVLEKRAELPRLQARRFGAQAAYLLIRYGHLEDLEIENLLVPLNNDAVPLAKDLTFAWSYGMSDGITEKMLGPDSVAQAISRGDISAIRAMIREGDIDELMTAIAADPDAPNGGTTVISVLDYSDAQKAELAKAASAHGLPILAAGFLATQEKAKAWDVFVGGLDPETASAALTLWYWMPPAMGNPTLPRPGANEVMARKFSDVLIAAMKIPQHEFLNTLLNQSGRVDEVVSAAAAVREAAERGAIDPRGTFDAAWYVAYRALTEVWDDLDELQGQLRSFEVAPERSAPPDRTLGVIERIVAIAELTPYLRGETASPPAMPPILSADFAAQWPLWIEIADRIRADPTDPSLLAGDAMQPAAEMLFAGGEADALAASIAATPVSLGLMGLAQDMANRLDRMCESYLWHPAESTLLGGTPIFKFDGRDNQ